MHACRSFRSQPPSYPQYVRWSFTHKTCDSGIDPSRWCRASDAAVDKIATKYTRPTSVQAIW